MGPLKERDWYCLNGLSAVSAPVVLITDVIKTWSPVTMGELHARPGISDFQTTLLSGPQDAGSERVSSSTPPSRPRNCGQS